MNSQKCFYSFIPAYRLKFLGIMRENLKIIFLPILRNLWFIFIFLTTLSPKASVGLEVVAQAAKPVKMGYGWDMDDRV